MRQKIIKKSLSIVSIALLIFVIFYLGKINHTSEIYVKVSTHRLNFKLVQDVKLFDGWQFKKVQIRNAEAKFDASPLREKGIKEQSVGVDLPRVDIGPLRAKKPNWIKFISEQPFYCKGIDLKKGSIVTIELGSNSIRLFVASSDSVDNAYSIFSVQSDTLTTYGNFNVLKNSQAAVRDYRPSSYIMDEFSRNIGIYHLPEESFIEMEIDTSNLESNDFIVNRFITENLRLDEQDVMTRDPFSISGVHNAKVQIGSADIFGKRFQLNEMNLEPGDFLIFGPSDRYIVQFEGIAEGGINASLYCSEATELMSGKQISFVKSNFPTYLDYIVAEPGKKVIWSFFLFLITTFLSQWQRIFPAKDQKTNRRASGQTTIRILHRHRRNL